MPNSAFLARKSRKRSGSKKAAPLFIIPLIFALDRLTKQGVIALLGERESRPVIPGIFHLTRVTNTGAAFGLFRESAPLLISVSVTAIGVLSFYLIRKIFFLSQGSSNAAAEDKFFFSGSSFVIAGALGNLVDRLQYGYVVDFFDFRIWPVFNLADMSVCFGVFLLLIPLLKK